MLAAMAKPSAAEAKSSPSSFATRPPKKRSSIWTRCARSLRNPRFRCAVRIEEPKKPLKEVLKKAAIGGQEQGNWLAETPQQLKPRPRRHFANQGGRSH